MTKRPKRTLKGFSISTPLGGFGATWDQAPLDIGEHHTSPENIEGDEDDINFDYEPHTLRIDRRAYFSAMLVDSAPSQISMARVALDEPSSLWRSITLNTRDGIHMAEDFTDPTLSTLYGSAKKSFHQISRTKHDNRNKDPTLDIVILNNSDNAVVIEGVGIVPIAVWAVPKHIAVPHVIHRSAAYDVHIKLARRMSGVRFDDPLLMSSKIGWRFSMKLVDLSAELEAYRANECLMAVRVATSYGAVLSEPLYFGVL